MLPDVLHGATTNSSSARNPNGAPPLAGHLRVWTVHRQHLCDERERSGGSEPRRPQSALLLRARRTATAGRRATKE